MISNENGQNLLSQKLIWETSPKNVLVIKKPCNALFEAFNEVVQFLIFRHHLSVYVEEDVFNHEIFMGDLNIKNAIEGLSEFGNESMIKVFNKSSCERLIESPPRSPRTSHSTAKDENKIDFIVCIGGDGTILHTSSLFQRECPPVLSIHMGSLGFLCPFEFENYPRYIAGTVKGSVPLLFRNRLSCRLEQYRNSANESFNQSAVKQFESLALNEIVISRGPSSFISNLDLYVNDYLITTVQGDGLIISSPTGSTAYAMAAGASMSHPSLPAIIITPICPHSLSFRPIVVPANVELKIQLNADSRHTAWFSIDGCANRELKQDFQLKVTTSEYPLRSICRSDSIDDWFEGLATCLHWNKRQKQLPLNECFLKSRSSLSSSLSSLLNQNLEMSSSLNSNK